MDIEPGTTMLIRPAMSRQWQLLVWWRAESRRPVRGSAPCLHNIQQTEGRAIVGTVGMHGHCTGKLWVHWRQEIHPIVLRRYTSNVQRTLQSAWSLLLGHSAAPRSWWPFTAIVLPFARFRQVLVEFHDCHQFFSFAHFCTACWALASCNCRVLETWAFQTLDLIWSAQTLD